MTKNNDESFNKHSSVIDGNEVGIVGLGFMGSSIAASLLAVGHKVIAISPVSGELDTVTVCIKDQLRLCEMGGFLKRSYTSCIKDLVISEDYNTLKNCSLVVECVVEDVLIKQEVFKKIADVVAPNTILASNTSAIPISKLQEFIENPGRFLGIHWAEPAFATRFLEIICGNQTAAATAERVFELANLWGKEPTVLKKDIRGFITNRLLYSVYRETLALIEDGTTNVEDADKAFRYDAGSWITLMGIFRRMDYLGLQDYQQMLNNLLPILNCTDVVPAAVQQLMDENARGTKNGIGFYKYTEEEGKKWNTAFENFNQDIYRVATHYPSNLINEAEEN